MPIKSTGSGNVKTYYGPTGGLTILNGSTTRATLSGALTANTYKEIVALNVPGVLHRAGVSCVDSTARTIYCKVTIDGVDVAEASVATSAGTQGTNAVGITNDTATYGMATESAQLTFKTLSLKIKSSLSETDKLYLNYVAHTL